MLTDRDLKELLHATVLGSCLALLVGIFKGIVLSRYDTLGTWFRGVGMALFVGNVVGWALLDYGASTFKAATAIALSSLFAEQILSGMGDMVELVRSNPFGFIARLRAAWAAKPYHEEREEKKP